MKIQDMRGLKSDELHVELDRLRRHLFDLRSQQVTQKLEDSSQLGKIKRQIAQVFTVLRDRGETDIEQRQYHLESTGTARK